MGEHLRRIPLQTLYRQRSGELNALLAGTIDEDRWTHSRSLNPHRPLHVAELEGDGPGPPWPPRARGATDAGHGRRPIPSPQYSTLRCVRTVD